MRLPPPQPYPVVLDLHARRLCGGGVRHGGVLPRGGGRLLPHKRRRQCTAVHGWGHSGAAQGVVGPLGRPADSQKRVGGNLRVR